MQTLWFFRWTISASVVSLHLQSSADPAVAMPGGVPLAEINMGDAIYSTPFAANRVLYIAN